MEKKQYPNIYTCETLKTFYRYRNGAEMYDLRLVVWKVNGRAQPPTFEHREFYTDRKGNEQLGKVKGLTAQDMYRIADALPELSRLMGFPLPKTTLLAALQEEAKEPLPLFGQSAALKEVGLI